jgi:flagellum-specific ATP synthase
MADYAAAEDLINVGAYAPGSNPATDDAIARRGAIEDFLEQDVDDKSTMTDTLKRLGEIAGMRIPGEEAGAYLA